MNFHYTEPYTQGVFKFGNEVLIKDFLISKPLGLYTIIQNFEQPIELLIDNTPKTLLPNQLITLTPEQYFSVKKLNGCRVYQFNSDFYCIKDHDKEVNCTGLLFYSNTQTSIASLNAIEIEKLDHICKEVLEEFENEDFIQGEMLRILLKNIIIRCTRLIKKQNPKSATAENSKNELLRQFNMLVETNFRKEHQVTFYADLLFKSAKTLSNNFNHFNTSPLQIIHNRIVLETKRLLLYSDDSLKEIAYTLGFSEASKLSKLFKNKVGTSPLAFRKEQLLVKNRKN